jgi:hypothetical protein
MRRERSRSVGVLLSVVLVLSSVTLGEADPDPQASPPIVYGDLTHLEFSATGHLAATLISPKDGAAANGLAAIFEVATSAGAGVELAVDGTVVPFARIGKRTVDGKTGETHYVYYGVPLVEGPNRVVLTPLGANGMRGTELVATVYGPGRPQRLQGFVIGHPQADGKTPFVLRILAFDRYGHPAATGSQVRVAIVAGDATFAPASNPARTAGESPPLVPLAGGERNVRPIGDLTVTSQQADATLNDGGTADIALVPGLRAGDVRFRVSSDTATADVRAYLDPALRKPLVVGIVTAGVGSVPGAPGEAPNVPDGADSRRGRIAFYGVGQVTKTAEATIAYDTAGVLDETAGTGSFTDDPDSRPYLTYGDGSFRRDDALSRDHLYARIDSGRSNAMWGEFVADSAGSNALGGFQQLVSGAKVEIAGSEAKLVAFAARNDIAYARQVFSPTGLAGVGSLLQPDIVVGSDTITLVALDRHTGAIVSQTVLTRNVDYTLDYSSGYLRFLNPPLPFDAYFNPQQLLVQYEYGGPGANAETTGGRASVALDPAHGIMLGAGYVNDATGSGNVTVFGQDVSGRLPGGSWSVSHLGTHGSGGDGSLGVPQLSLAGGANGDAYEAAMLASIGPNKLDLGFQTTSPGFDNPFGGLSTPGLLEYHVDVQRTFGAGGTVTASFQHDQNDLPLAPSSQSDAALHARLPVTKRFAVSAGIDLRSSSSYASGAVPGASPAPVPTAAAYNPGGGVAQADVGFEYKISQQIKLEAARVQDLGSNASLAAPAQTSAEADLDFPRKGRVFVRELWTDAATSPLAESTSALTAGSGARSTTEIGAERAVGGATTLDSDYVIDRTASGTDAYAEMGVREKLDLAKDLKGDLTVQRAADFGGAAGDAATAGAFDLYGLSLAYAGARFHATTQYQLRTGDGAGYTFDVAAAGALSPDVSAFVDGNTSRSSSGFNTVDNKATLAYRPANDDRGVALVSYERQDGNVSALGTHAEVLSFEELYRPTGFMEIAVRFAHKLDGDSYYPARSSLVDVRVDRRLTRRFDLALEGRTLDVAGIDGASASGLALEGGYRLGDAMRVAVGYNVSGSPDPNLVAAPQRRGFYATLTSTIDNILGWGKNR